MSYQQLEILLFDDVVFVLCRELQKELETVKQNVEAKTREIAEKTKMVTKVGWQ